MTDTVDDSSKNVATSDSSFSDPLRNQKEWVKFDDESSDQKISSDPIANETVETKDVPKNNGSKAETSTPAIIEVPSTQVSQLSTIDLPSRRRNEQEGFANGDIIVSLLPVNENASCSAWITPAVFKPYLVPEELMSSGLTLSIEEYVEAIEMLVNDYRFHLYNVCYKRILILWITVAFFVLLGLLFSGITGILLFSLGVSWLFLNAVSIFLCIWMKYKLASGLEKCLAKINKSLMRHKIAIALDDRGNISCHKIHLCFIYFDSSQCISYINSYLERREHNGQTIEPGWEEELEDIVIQGAKNITRVSRKQNRGENIVIRYMSRYGKDRVRGYLKVSGNQAARHMNEYLCPCQYIENHLNCKPQGSCSCWPINNDNHLYAY